MTETPYQRVGRLQRERKAAREATLKATRRRSITGGRGPHKRRSEETYEDRLDDLGESPDW